MIERIVTVRSKIKSVTTVIPGYQERLSPTSLVRFIKSGASEFTATDLFITSDDKISITYIDYNGDGYTLGGPRTISLSKHAINEHTIQSDRTLFGRVVLFEWIPPINHLKPQDEESLRRLIADGTYTDEVAQEVRDFMIYEAQKQRKELSSPQRKLSPPKS